MENYTQIEMRAIVLSSITIEGKYKLPYSYGRNGILKYDPKGGMWAIFDTIKEAVRFIRFSNN